MLLFPLVESSILLIVSILLLLLLVGLMGIILDNNYLIWFCSMIKEEDKLI